MLNNAAAGRRLALRVVAWQAAAVLLASVTSLLAGPRTALAVLVGGAALALGSLLAAQVALGGGVVRSREAFLRLLAGTLCKWFVAGGLLSLAMGPWRLPALPVLGGLGVALATHLLAGSGALQKFGRFRRSAEPGKEEG